MTDGLVDANVFVHAFMDDDRAEECVRFLRQVQSGSIQIELHPLVVHELTYVFKRFGIFRSDTAIAEYVRSVLQWPGIVGDNAILDRALERWGSHRGVSFVDSYLIETALPENRPVYTINVRHFAPYGVTTPSPLPDGS